MNINDYSVFLFDCDGVLLDSNNIKVDAFYRAVKHYSKDGAKKLAEYHMNTGGVSRFEKFKYFFEEIMGRTDDYSHDYEKALDEFAKVSYKGLLECPETNGMRDFIKRIPSQSYKYVISGTENNELREVLKKRGLARYFDGIFGSPARKEEIFSKLIGKNIEDSYAIYFGDAKKDYQVAMEFNTDFVFVSGYTGFSDWKTFFEGKNDKIINDFTEI